MRNYLWVVEEHLDGDWGGWIAWATYCRPTRRGARNLQASLKKEDKDIVTRIRQYLRREV